MIRRQSDLTGQHERVQRVRSMVKDRDEDLTLFQDMRNRELNSYLHPSKEDIELSLTTKFGGISGYRVMAPLTPKKGANDLLASDAEKNDYDWLLTPPGTPLFPSLDQENTSLRQSHRDFSARSASFTRSSRLPNLQEYSTSVVSRRMSGLRQPGSGASASFGTGITRVQSTSAPALVSLSPRSRSSTPTRRSASPNRGKSNPSSVRSKTPTSRPSTPPFRTLNPPSRASTPTARSKTPNSRSLTPTMRRSLSCPVASMDSSTRSSSSTRGNSPSRKSTTSSLVALGLSLQPPPNLRTTMPERSMSTSRGVSARVRANNLLLQAQNIDALDLNICQQHPGSPHLSISSSSVSHETEVFSSHSSHDSVISPHQEFIGPVHMAQISSKLGTNPRKSRITQIDPSNSKATLHVRKFAKTSTGRPAFSSGRGNSKKSTEAASWYNDIRQNTSRGFRPLMTSNFNTTFYTKSSNLEDHPSSSLFENSVNNGSNASSEYGATVAPWSDYDDRNGEAILQRDHSGSFDGTLTCSVEQATDTLAHVERRYEDDHSVVNMLETKHVGDAFPEDANLSESDGAQHLCFNAGLERNGNFERGAYNVELENGCNKETICMQKCNVLLNLSASCLKTKASATSTGKNPILHKDVDQNHDHQDHVKVEGSEHEAAGFPFVAGITGIQRTCAEMLNVEDSKAVDVVRQGSLVSALVLESDVHQGFLICSENQSSEFQFEDKMDIDYSDPKLGHEGRENCLEEEDVQHVSMIPAEMKSTHVQCQNRLLDPNCSNSSMEIYQFNEHLELSSVETEMSSACKYAESPCVPPITDLDYHRLEDNNSSDHQSGANSDFSEPIIQSATRLLIHPEAISAKSVCRTISNLAKAGMNDKLHPKIPDGKALLSDKAKKGSPSKSCNDHLSVESMTWQVKGDDDARTAHNCSDYQEGQWKSHKSIVQTSMLSGELTGTILSRLSSETEDLEHCARLLHVEGGVTIEENMNFPAGYLEMLEYDSEAYAGMEVRMCVDDHGDALAQEKCCMTEPEMALKWSPESIITVKEVTAISMDEHEDSPLSSPGAGKSGYMSGDKVVALLRQDEADNLSENCWKEDCLLEEEQMKGVAVCAEDVLSIICSSSSLSSNSNSHEPMHGEDTLIEDVRPQTFDTINETSQFPGEDSHNEICFLAFTGGTTKATEIAMMCTSIVHDLVSRAVALALEKEASAAFAMPASTKELVTLLGASETKRKIQNQTGIMEPGTLNELNVGAGSTVSRTLTYMQNQKVMQSATVGYLQSPVGKVKEDMRDEDDSMLAAFEIDEKDDAATRTKHKCCCTIM